MEDKFEEWLDKEIKQLEKQSKGEYCHSGACIFELITKIGLELKIAYLDDIPFRQSC